MSGRRILLLGVLVVLVVRVWLARATEGTTFSDNAVVALMAMHILQGKLYAIYWGQTYMGSLEAYGVAPFFAVLGVSDFALSLGLTPWSILFACGLFGIARRGGGYRAGAIAIVLAALAPPYLLFYQVTARGGYPETLAFGTLLLWLCFRVVYDRLPERSERWHLIAIGFVAGLAFWTNWLVFPYFAVIGPYLLLHDPRLMLRRSGWFALLAFFVGSAPLWSFNLRTGFSTFAFLETVQAPAGRAQAFQYAVGTALPHLIGARDDYQRFVYGWPGKLLAVAAALAAGGLVLGLWRSWIALAKGHVDRTHPSLALVLLVVATVAIYSVGDPGRFHVARYLLPATTATIVLIALGLSALFDRSRLAGSAAIVALLTLYVAEVRDLHRGFVTLTQRAGAGQVESLLEHVLASGIRYGYADYGDATITTYLARDRVVLLDYHGLRYPSDEVDAHDPAVIVRNGGEPAGPTLRALDARFTETSIPGYTVYWPIRYDGVPRRPLRRRDWKVSASEGSEDAPAAIDGDRWTYWSAPASVEHPSFTVDLGGTETVTGICIDHGDRGHDFFRRVRVEASTDGVNWRSLVEARWGLPVYFNRRGEVTTRPANVQYVLFTPVAVRWLRLTRLEGFLQFDWSIGELAVFGAGGGSDLFEVPEFADPQSPSLVERRLRQEIAREPENNVALLDLAEFYRSARDRNGERELERIGAERFTPRVALDWRFGRDLTLLGVDCRAGGGRDLEITYYWRAERTMSSDYAVFLHGRQGDVRFQDDYILGAPATTSRWRRGQIVKQTRQVTVPPGAPDGRYAASLGVWEPKTGRHPRLGGWWSGRRSRRLLDLDVGGGRIVSAELAAMEGRCSSPGHLDRAQGDSSP
jgi:4-amino-4-deoxy-L-arabinose transferase-like glycosyltransferase